VLTKLYRVLPEFFEVVKHGVAGSPIEEVLLTFRTCICPIMGLEGALFTFPI
jgi:hypothetical protein